MLFGYSDSYSSIPDGSLSPLLTTSGVSSEDVFLTDGQYGSVVTDIWGGTMACPANEPRIDLHLG
jgi:hypothetical protein